MENPTMPLYAITELLIRMSSFHKGLGEYQDHTINQWNVMVTTTTGSLKLSKDLISKQAFFPATVNDEELMLSAFTFQSLNFDPFFNRKKKP